jgi:hypothetical protein
MTIQQTDGHIPLDFNIERFVTEARGTSANLLGVKTFGDLIALGVSGGIATLRLQEYFTEKVKLLTLESPVYVEHPVHQVVTLFTIMLGDSRLQGNPVPAGAIYNPADRPLMHFDGQRGKLLRYFNTELDNFVKANYGGVLNADGVIIIRLIDSNEEVCERVHASLIIRADEWDYLVHHASREQIEQWFRASYQPPVIQDHLRDKVFALAAERRQL